MSTSLEQLREKIFSKYRKDTWEIKTIGEIAIEIVSGSEITKEQLNTGKTEAIKYIGKSTPLKIMKGEDLVDSNLIKKKKYCEKGDILFAKFNRIQEIAGRSSVYLGEEKCLVGAGVIVLKHNQNPKYLAYVLSTEFIRKQMNSILQESTVFQLYPKNLKLIKIPLPSLEIQKEIVEFLDKYIELERELERELEMRKKQYEYYRDNEIKKGIEELKWEIKKMEEIATEIISGSEINRDQLGIGDHPAIRAGDINSFLPIKFTECISFVDEKSIKDKKIFSRGDILMSNIGNKVSKVGIATAYMGEKKGFAGVGVNIIKHNQNPIYLSFVLSSKFAKAEIKKLAQKSTVYRLYPSTIKQIQIPLPPLNEQVRVVENLDKLFRIVHDLKEGIPFLIQKYREEYETYRDLLLEK